MALYRIPPYVNGVNRWNGVTILSSRYISTSGLAAAIFEFRLPVTSDGIRKSPVKFLDTENGGLAVRTDRRGAQLYACTAVILGFGK
jgi:hypothetical protein